MIEFGKTLREAREAKGMTISQIAETTHMMSAVVQNLEDEDFSKIVAPIYGRGFVKLYCEAVGLDAKPLVDEFMAIYNGNRTPEIKERPVATPAEPPPPPPPAEPVATPEPAAFPEPVAAPPPPPQKNVLTPEPPPPDMDRLFSRDKPDANPEPTQANEYDLFDSNPPSPEPPRTAEPRPETNSSRYAPPVKDLPKRRYTPAFSLPSISVPPNTWRLALLALVTAAIVALLCFGLTALYHATTDRPADAGPKSATQPAPSVQPTPAPAKATPAPAEKKPVAAPPAKTSDQDPPAASAREPQKIPSLFID